MESRFLTSLAVEDVCEADTFGRARWRLLTPLVYESAMTLRPIRVPAGFVTDFASVPRLPLAFLIAGDCAHRAAVVHDYLYGFHRFIGRAKSDAVFYEAAVCMHVPAWRAWIMWAGVRLFGWRYWRRVAGRAQQELCT